MYVPCNILDILTVTFYSLFIRYSSLTRHIVFYVATLHLPTPSQKEALRALDLYALSSLCELMLPSIFVPASTGLSLPLGCKYHAWARGTHTEQAESKRVSSGITAHHPTQRNVSSWLPVISASGLLCPGLLLP